MSLELAKFCFCGGAAWQPAFSLSAPPDGETRFDLPVDAYHREFCQCPRCGHLHGRHRIDLGFLYDGAYVDATYGDYDGIARTFDRIVGLPPDRSDNAGRVARIEAFAGQGVFAGCGALAGCGTLAGRSGLERDGPRPRLLDIGAGLGVFPHAMASRGWEVSAIDPDPRAARHMRERLGLTVIESDIFDIRAESIGPFDAVTLNKVLEHVVEPVDLLRRAAGFLNENGFVYFEVPDGPGALREGVHREEFFIEHHHAFSEESARHLARTAGLVPVESQALVEPSGKYTITVFARP